MCGTPDDYPPDASADSRAAWKAEPGKKPNMSAARQQHTSYRVRSRRLACGCRPHRCLGLSMRVACRPLAGQARQAGGHWFEPSTAHLGSPRKSGGFRFPGRQRGRGRGRKMAAPEPEDRNRVWLSLDLAFTCLAAGNRPTTRRAASLFRAPKETIAGAVDQRSHMPPTAAGKTPGTRTVFRA
jgi:hypothetical protein